MSYGYSSSGSGGGGGSGKSSGGGGSYNPTGPTNLNGLGGSSGSYQPTGSAPATGGSYGKSPGGQNLPFGGTGINIPQSAAADAALGGDNGANFFSGIANNAPGGAYGATQQATDQANSANQSQQMGGPLGNTGAQTLQSGQAGIASAMSPQDAYNSYQNVLQGTPAAAYTPNFAGTPGGMPANSDQQNQMIAAQTGLFQNQLTPQDAYNSYSNMLYGQPAPAPFTGTSQAPATVRPQPVAAPAPVVAKPVVAKPVVTPKPAPVVARPAPFKPVLTRPGVQPALRTAPKPPGR